MKAPRHAMKAWFVMCCGCGRAMNDSGQPELQVAVGGVVQLNALANNPEAGLRLASFDTKEEADKTALGHGWSVKDEDGPNHRCPPCRAAYESKRAEDPPRRGAYLSSALFELASERGAEA